MSKGKYTSSESASQQQFFAGIEWAGNIASPDEDKMHDRQTYGGRAAKIVNFLDPSTTLGTGLAPPIRLRSG
jgi:hypothetical protein